MYFGRGVGCELEVSMREDALRYGDARDIADEKRLERDEVQRRRRQRECSRASHDGDKSAATGSSTLRRECSIRSRFGESSDIDKSIR